MRESVFLRIATLAVVLPIVAAVCVFALLVTGALNPRIPLLVAAGGAILIIAVLAAAISALGPKFRPTPLLTPLFAGVFAALLATTALYAAHAQIAPKRSAVATVDIKPAAEPVAKAAPAAEPRPAAPPAGFMPMFDTADFMPAAPTKMRDQLPPAGEPATAAEDMPAADQPETEPTATEAQPLPEDAADRAAMGGPLTETADAAVTPVNADVASGAAEPGTMVAVAVAGIPLPAAAPEAAQATATANPDAPLTLTTGFDPTGPVEPAAEGPPMELDGFDVATAAPAHQAAIPPLPRIRPCGGAGPACR